MRMQSQFTTFWQMACGLGLPAAAAAAAAQAQVVQNAGNPGASLALALGGGFFAAAGSIWGSLYAGRRQKRDDAEEAERARLFNHDLAKAVAKSIATLLGPLADEKGLSAAERGAIEAMMGRAEEAWLRVAEAEDPAFAPILEERLAEAVTIDPDKPKFGRYGDEAMWREVVRRMAAEVDAIEGADEGADSSIVAHFEEGSELVRRAAQVCREGFARQFFNDLKHDFATKGQAFAAVHLRMMGEMVTLARVQAASNADMHTKLDAIAEAVNRRGEEIVAWIGEDQATGGKRIASLRPITSWLKSIDVKLAGIDRKASDIIERLKRIEKQGVRTEQVVREGFGKARKSEAEAHGATRRRLGEWIGGTAAIVVVAVLGTYALVSRQAGHEASEAEKRHEESRQQADARHAEQMAQLAALTEILDRSRVLPTPMLDAEGKIVTSAPSFTDADRAVAAKAAESEDPLTRAKAAIIAGNPEEARAELERIADPLKLAIDYLTAMGDSFYFEERFDEAVPYYEQAMELLGSDPTPKAMLNLANALTQASRGDVAAQAERSIKLYTQCVTHPDAVVEQVATALGGRGHAHAQRGQSKQAIADYTRVMELLGAPPGDVATSLYNRGNTHGEQGRWDEAIQDFTRAIELPGSPAVIEARALYNRGVMHTEQGEPERAIADFTRASEFPGAHAEVIVASFFSRGVLYGAQGRLEEAIADYTRAIELPGSPARTVAASLLNRGVAHGIERRREEMIEDFTRAIELHGAPAEVMARALYGRAFAHTLSNEVVACRDLAEAARIYESVGDTARAEQTYRTRQQLGCP